MSKQTKIEWCDSKVNFWSGCTKVLDQNGKLTESGCKNCYAEARDNRHMIEPVSHWGPGVWRLKHVGAVKQALAFNRKPWICDACGKAFAFKESHACGHWSECSFHRRRIFSLGLGDWLDDEVPIEWLEEMLDTIRQCDQVEWILCTKRPENFGPLFDTLRRLSWPKSREWIDRWFNGDAPNNITLLASVENQAMADIRIPQLLAIPAARRGLSLEPLLGPVDLITRRNWLAQDTDEPNISWLIIGGESGPKARPCNVEWIRLLVRQGKAAGVATFVKQLGSDPTYGNDTPIPEIFTNKKGGDPSEWPEDLRVQEWPKD